MSCSLGRVGRWPGGGDEGALFDQMREPGSVWMAAFSAEHPDDKTAFIVHLTKQRNSPDITLRAITCDGQLVGCIGSFAFQGQTEVTCWIGPGSLGPRHRQPGPGAALGPGPYPAAVRARGQRQHRLPTGRPEGRL
jgi:hypothetical protein